MTDEMATFRAQELLLKRATEGLDDAEARELAALGADQDISFDLAAAAIDIATIRSIEELPAGVADKVLVAAGVNIPTTIAGASIEDFAPPGMSPSTSTPFTPTTLAGAPMPQRSGSIPTPASSSTPFTPSTLAGVKPARPIGAPASMPEPLAPATTGIAGEQGIGATTGIGDELARRRKSRVPMILAYVAMAAGIALAIGAVLWARNHTTSEVAAVTPAEGRAKLLASAKDVTTLAWTATDDAAAKGASGDIVWSQSEQKGFMRFVGLAKNDPKLLQYQLWIFDKTRDQAFPIDGGVFDVVGNDVIVPITAKLPVGEPVLFAVTVEKPGGVVVSKRERIVVTAKS